jgi:hypothetical protein
VCVCAVSYVPCTGCPRSLRIVKLGVETRPVDPLCYKILSIRTLSHAGISVHQLLQRLTAIVGVCMKAHGERKEEAVRVPGGGGEHVPTCAPRVGSCWDSVFCVGS